MQKASPPRGLKFTLALLWQYQMLGKLQCLLSDSYIDQVLCRKWSSRKVEPDADIRYTLVGISRSALRHVGALCRLIIWCYFKPIFLKFFDLEQDWYTFLGMCEQTMDNFAVKFLHMWKHEFTGTIFPIIPVMS
jgi:hypothetical protein